MKVIFLKDLAGTARADEVKWVSDGYAVNYLLPRQLAIRATDQALRQLAERQARIRRSAEFKAQWLRRTAGDLAGQTVKIFARAASSGKLFAAVTNKQITVALRQQHQLELEPDMIILAKPIKTVGDHQVEVKLSPEVQVNLTVTIVNQLT